jgi:DNA invertase Pin-like site-specific DNA recombinase
MQRKGGGLERQTKADVEEFCRRFGFTPGKRIWVDDGVSAWKGLNATPKHQLGQFLAEARRGNIHPGDCLLLEKWDRLSRQDIWAAIGLVNDLRQLGIHVSRLYRMKLLRCDSTDPGDFFEAAVELMRGHSENAAKSDRNGKAWGKRRQRARDGEKLLTRRLPAWVEERGGRLYLNPERAALVKRVFRLAAAGYGHGRIVGLLNREKVPTWGKKPRTKEQVEAERDLPKEQRAPLAPAEWQRPYVSKLLRDKRVLGEMQPHEHGKPDGPPIPGYFPRVVEPDDWWAAQAPRGRSPARYPAGSKDDRDRPQGGQLRTTRKRKPYQEGGRHINLFKGLLQDAAGGASCTGSTSPRPARTAAAPGGPSPCPPYAGHSVAAGGG